MKCAKQCETSNAVRSNGWRWFAGIASAVALPCLLAAGELPTGYVPIEYVQGDGANAYMNTGWTVCPTSDVIQVEFAVVNTNLNETLFCARGEGPVDRTFTVFLLGASQAVRWDFKSAHNISIVPPKPLAADVKYTLTASNGSFEMDNGIRYDAPPDAAFVEAGGPLYLFCAYQNTAWNNYARSSFGTYRLYSLKFWRSGELIHDCVPFRSAAKTDVGLWDQVENQAVPRAGSFIAGPDNAKNVSSIRLPDQEVDGTVPELKPRLEVRNASGRLLTPREDYTVDYVPGPVEGRMRAHVVCQQGSGAWGATNVDFAVRRPVPAAYERLDYIQGDGASWLLTDYVPNPQTDVIALDYSLPRVETTALLCARDSNYDGYTWSFCIINDQYRFDYLNASLTKDTPASRILTDKRYTVTLSNNQATVSCAYKSTKELNPGHKSTYNPLQFYAFYVNGPNSGKRNTISYYKTYGCRVWRSGVLIHEWVPVRRLSDEVATLYDTVEQKALEPLGTGAFIAGNVLPTPVRSVAVADIPVQELTDGICTPTPVVTDPVTGQALVPGTDYEVAYADNATAGTATATVTGLGDYAGVSVAVPFTILMPLPQDYERLAYIQGDGSAYLLTDWTVRPDDDRLDTEIEITRDNTAEVIWCSRGGTTVDKSFTLFHLADGTFRWDNLDVNWTFARGSSILIGVRYAVHVTNQGELRFGDRACVVRPKDRVFPEAGGPLMLFASYFAGTWNNIQYPSTHRLYGLSVRRDGAPGRDWVPVKTESGVATLFDRVTGTTLPPRGSGSFIAGSKPADFDLYVRDVAWNGEKRVHPQVAATNRVTGAELKSGADYLLKVVADIPAGHGTVTATGAPGSAYAGQSASAAFEIHAMLPKDYTRLSWLQGDGQTCLPTGIMPNPVTDRIQLEFEPVDESASGLFCARSILNADSWSCCILSPQPRFRFDYFISTTFPGNTGPVLPNQRYVVDVANRSCVTSSGENIPGFAPDDMTEAGGPLVLFSYYNQPQEGTLTPVSCSRAKFFGVKMYRSGELLHDWVPVRTPEGVVTLYDFVDQTSLEPLGPGLLAGPVVEYSPPPPEVTIIILR